MNRPLVLEKMDKRFGDYDHKETITNGYTDSYCLDYFHS